MKPTLAVLIFLFLIISGNSQPNKKFGIIKPEDFSVKSALIDSSTSALVIYDVGNCEFEGNTNGWFSIVFTRHTRIKILNKNGYNAATVREILYVAESGSEEKMEEIKASTFTLDNNIVNETKLNKNDVISSKYNNSFTTNVFTLPAVKEGCIIEYTYKIRSEYISYLRPWKFESEFPCLYNEYTVAIPSIFYYVSDLRQSIPLKLSHNDYYNTFIVSETENNAYSSPSTFTVHGSVFETKWIANDIPKIKTEPFVRTTNNFISKVDFQLLEVRIPNQPVSRKYNSWDKASEKLRKSVYFGEQMFASNHWLKEPLKTIAGNITDTLTLVKKVFEFVRDNFSKTGEGSIYISENTSLKDVFNSKKGSSTDLNMLLISMLRRLEIDAEPTILSTRKNGIVHPYYPIFSEYNYLVVRVKLANKDYFLDASDPYIGFNKLPLKCYNGFARVMSTRPYVHEFSCDSIKEKENIFVIVSSDEKGATANIQEELGYYHSSNFREQVGKRTNKEISDLLKKDFSFNCTITDLDIDSLNSNDIPLKLNYSVNFNFKDDIVYFNPLLNYALKENPFVSDTRKYQIEKPNAYSLTYSLTFNIPSGYSVEEIPKSVKAKLNDDEGSFEYLVSASNDIIQMRCKYSFAKATYSAEDYQSIRDFYSIIVKKMNEDIVLKKIK